MKRRDFFKQAALGTVGLELARTWSAEAAQDNVHPNFLVILTDDQTYRAIGYTNPHVITPHLNQLASEGITFTQAYIASPICVASRASLMTGVYPQQHGSAGLDASGFQKSVIEDHRFQTPAQMLTTQGYLTGFAGKSHLGPPHEYGFQEGIEYQGPDDVETFAAASSFMQNRAADGKPFFFWLATRQPHLPLLPTEEWTDLYRDKVLEVDPNFLESPPAGSLYNQGLPGEQYYRDSDVTKNYKGLHAGPPRSREEILDFMRAYYASISHVDYQIGSLMDLLKDSGLYENTVIVFTSDNGYHLGNHGLGNKITMHEESVRIPMFVRWGGLPKKGVPCDELVSSLDIYPTLMDLAGIQKPAWLEGKSLVPLFQDPDHATREYVTSECVGVGGKLGTGHRMVRTKKWKYILTDANEEALFDEEADPFEMENLASLETQREILNQLRDTLRGWMKQIGDSHAPPP